MVSGRRRGGIAALAVAASCILTVSVAPPALAEEDTPRAPVTLADRISEAADSGAAGKAEIAQALGIPESGPNSLASDGSGLLTVTVVFAAAPTPAERAAVSEIAAIHRVFSFTPALEAAVRPDRLTELEALPGVTAVVPVVEPSTDGTVGKPAAVADPAAVESADASDCRSVPVEADAPLRTGLAREVFGTDGSGVTIGIISDSFATSTASSTTPEQDVALGVLPGVGNPCGYDTPVEVLGDQEGSDEGRAMAQLIHGIAPGARLVFASGWGGPHGMAEAIVLLGQAGADVIVDDLGYASETYFQQGLISAAISSVRDHGVAYYSAAGNSNVAGASGTHSAGKPIAGWQTSAFRGVECPAWVWVPTTVTDFDCLDFDPTSTVASYERLGLNGTLSPQFLLSWGEPILGVTSAFSLQLYTDEIQPALVNAGNTFDARVPNELLAFADTPSEGTYRLVVVRDRTGRAHVNDPAVWIGIPSGADALSWREFDQSHGADRVGPVTYGHAADGSATGVAAAAWLTPGEPEPFSSIGPGTQLFAPFDPTSLTPAVEYPQPVAVDAPAITGVDGLATSFFGEEEDGVHRFYGTSAAAPTVAGVHALAASYAPGLAAVEVTDAMLSTAAGMWNPFHEWISDRSVFGTGLVDAYALLARLPAPEVRGLRVTALSASSIAAEWDRGSAVGGYRVELLADTGVIRALQLSSDETAVVLDGLEAEHRYRVRIAAVNDVGEPGPWVESVSVVTLPNPSPSPSAPPSPSATPVVPSVPAPAGSTPVSAVTALADSGPGLDLAPWAMGSVLAVLLGILMRGLLRRGPRQTDPV